MRLKLYRGSWCAVWRTDKGTQRVSLRTKDRDLAGQRLADLTGQAPAEITGTVDAIMQAYIAASEGKASHERMGYARKHIRPELGHLRPDQVTKERCLAYTAKRRREGASDGTIRKELGIMRSALRSVDKATPAVVALPPKPGPRERHLTRPEYLKLLFAARAPHMRLFIILALATAGRASAILDLTWDRIDFQRGRISLANPEKGKTRKGRATVPMTKAAREALAEAQRGALTDRVIEYAGAPVASIKKGFATTVKRAGLVDVSPHVLRHTAAVWMIEGGASIEEVAQYLGHTDTRTTFSIYARFSPQYLKGAAGALEI